MRLGIDINQLESHVIMIDCLYFDADFETAGLVICKWQRCGCYNYQLGRNGLRCVWRVLHMYLWKPAGQSFLFIVGPLQNTEK